MEIVAENKESKENIEETEREGSSKDAKSEQVRIIPISLPDGRHVINRSISNDVIEKSVKETSQTIQTSHSISESKIQSLNQLNESSTLSEKSDIFHPQDIDACNLSNQVFI